MYKQPDILYELLYLPKMLLIITLPIFLSSPALDVGIPVLRANCCFACVTPRALFQENDNPGIFIFSKNESYSCGRP